MVGSILNRAGIGNDGGRGSQLNFRFLPIIIIGVVLILLFTMGYTIETGHVGVTRTLGNVNPEEVGPGFHLKLPFLTQVREFSAKENAFDLENLTPKAA